MNPEGLFAAYQEHPGDAEGLRRLLEAVQGPVYALSYQVLRHREDAEDASQQVFLKLLDALPGLSDGEHLRRYLSQAALHTALDLKRSRARRRVREAVTSSLGEPLAPSATPEAAIDVLHEHVARLDPELREVLLDYYYSKQTLGNLADRFGCSTVAVWKRLEKAREVLRESLKLAGIAGAALFMERSLEAMATVSAPPGLPSPVLASIGASAGSSPGPLLANVGGMALKAKSALAAAGIALAAGVLCVAAWHAHRAEPAVERTGLDGKAKARARVSGPLVRGMAPEGALRVSGASSRSPRSAERAAARKKIQGLIEQFLAAVRTQDVAKMKAALLSVGAQFDRPPLPDGKNAAVIYRKAFERFNCTNEDWDRWEVLSSHDPLLPQDKAELRELLAKNGEALKLLHEAAELPACDFGLDYTKATALEMPHLSPMMTAARLLQTESQVAEDGQQPGVAKAMSRLGEALAGEPVLVSQLVRTCCQMAGSDVRERAIEAATSESTLQELLSGLPAENIRESLQGSLLFEFYSAATVFLNGDIGLVPRARGPEDSLGQADFELLAGTFLQYSDLLGEPYYEIRDRLDEISQTSKISLPWYAEMTAALLPTFGKLCERAAEAEASQGAIQVAAAAKLYHVQMGEYPQTLSDLSSVQPVLPLDPFSGQPYLYRREGSGFVVYSVGKDGQDNGGTKNPRESGLVIRVTK